MQLTVGGKPALRLAVGAGGQRGEEAVVRLDLLNLIVLKPSTQCGRMGANVHVRTRNNYFRHLDLLNHSP